MFASVLLFFSFPREDYFLRLGARERRRIAPVSRVPGQPTTLRHGTQSGLLLLAGSLMGLANVSCVWGILVLFQEQKGPITFLRKPFCRARHRSHFLVSVFCM